jgi:hypothetical protein
MRKRNPHYPGGLRQLLSENPAAKSYYDGLPDYVHEMVEQRADNIHTPSELFRYTENILAGDK